MRNRLLVCLAPIVVAIAAGRAQEGVTPVIVDVPAQELLCVQLSGAPTADSASTVVYQFWRRLREAHVQQFGYPLMRELRRAESSDPARTEWQMCAPVSQVAAPSGFTTMTSPATPAALLECRDATQASACAVRLSAWLESRSVSVDRRLVRAVPVRAEQSTEAHSASLKAFLDTDARLFAVTLSDDMHDTPLDRQLAQQEAEARPRPLMTGASREAPDPEPFVFVSVAALAPLTSEQAAALRSSIATVRPSSRGERVEFVRLWQ